MSTIDFDGINDALVSRARDFLPSLFPAGKFEGNEFKIGDIQGNPGRSLSINWRKGIAEDFSTGVKYDFVALYAEHHGLSMGEAARELGDGDRTRAGTLPPPRPAPTDRPKKIAIIPAPDDVPPPSTAWVRREIDGAEKFIEIPIVASWPYYSEQGLVGYACRVEFDDGSKDVLPFIWADGKGGPRWRQGGFPKPRPLYNGAGLVSGERVLILEGEKCVEHCKQIGVKRRPITWPGGGRAIQHVDWSPLAGCDVLLFPDHDKPGREAMANIAGRLLALGCKVAMIDHQALDLPDGWDIADTDWTLAEFNTWVAPLIQGVGKEAEAQARAERAAPKPSSDSTTAPSISPGESHPLSRDDNAFVSWSALKLECDGKGQPFTNVDNFIRILSRHPRLKGRLWFDEFHNRIFQTLLQPDPLELADHVDIEILSWLQGAMQMPKAHKTTVRDAINGVAMKDVRNEPVEWLNSLSWDGVERLPMMFCNVWGAPQNDYITAISRCFMVAMAARLLDPGCQADYLPIFEGGEGIGKSKALRLLGGKWHGENHEKIGSKDFYQLLPGKLIVEFPELHTITSADVRTVRGIISNPVDRYRESYGFRAADHRRRCVFAGTSNERDWNKSETGARRFWPVQCGAMNLDYLAENRAQLFAEALHRYRAEKIWWDFDEATAAIEQDARKTEDPWTQRVLEYSKLESFVRVDEILDKVLLLPVAAQDMKASRRVGNILKSLGYIKRNVRDDGKQGKVWVLPHNTGSIEF